MQVTVDIPDDLASRLIPAGEDPARTLLEQAALHAFVTSRITRAQLRNLLGLQTRYELDGFLKQHQIDHRAYGAEELEQDIQTIDELRTV